MSDGARSRAPGEARGGFTLIETMLTLGIFGVIVVSVFSITVQTSAFVGDSDVDFSVQAEATRAYQRLSAVLRESGWLTVGAVTYPQVLLSGKALEFRVLTDLDKNGYAFDKATGDLEWDARVFSVRRDPSNDTLSVYIGAAPVLVLGRHIGAVDFTTYLEDSSLNLKEIRVMILAQAPTRRGELIRFTASGNIYMRN